MNIQKSDRVVFFGQTGSGKSELCRPIFFAMQPPRIFIDVKDDPALATPGVPVVRDPARVLDYPTVRAVPTNPDDEGWFSAIYDAALDQRDTLIWLDEANEVSKPNYIPTSIRRFILQGRGRGCGHLACTPRPADVSPSFAAQAQHIFIFSLGHPRDLLAVSGLTGLPLATIERIMSQIPHRSYRFAHFEVATREITICDPAHDPDRLTAQIAARYYGSKQSEPTWPGPIELPDPTL